jgi:hypothetical protein
MHLYIDTFITDEPLRLTAKNLENINQLNNLRKMSAPYQWRPKIDIFKFTLLSYSLQKWKSVCINYECEKAGDADTVNAYIKAIFPNAEIKNKRSISANNFVDNLKKYSPNDWIFFATNNDHPIMSNEIINFDLLKDEAEKYSASFLTSILYSHLPEAYLSIKFGTRLYGYNRLNPKIIDETDNSYHVKYSNYCLDSIHAYKASQLLNFFLEDFGSKKRIIRPENLSSYFSRGKHIVIVPKSRISEHFDGYLHTKDLAFNYIRFHEQPPIFIPDGFFEKKYSINFAGFEEPPKDLSLKNRFDVSSCKRASLYSFQSDFGVDLKYCREELPLIYAVNAKNITVKCSSCDCKPEKKIYFNVTCKYIILSSFRFVRNYLYFLYKLINTRRSK